MCGIVAYTGFPKVADLAFESLKKLEYRGYDSAGIALRDTGHGLPRLEIARATGRLHNLEDRISEVRSPTADSVIGHTRWATHGAATESNAHPHQDCESNFAVVHNGVIENYQSLREVLVSDGHVFRSDTDSEVLAHLLERESARDPWPGSVVDQQMHLALIASRIMPLLQGAEVVVVLSRLSPVILAFRIGNAGGLAVGLDGPGVALASDIPAIASHASEFSFLESGEIVTAMGDKAVFYSTLEGLRTIAKSTQRITFTKGQTDHAGYSNFMLKEIFEQPESLRHGLERRIQTVPPDVSLADMLIADHASAKFATLNFERLILTGCGTPWNACLVGRQLFEDLAGIPCQVEYAHEYANRSALRAQDSLFIAVTQSGETADVLLALELANSAGATTLTITNVTGSAATRISDATWYLNSGPEFCVAETKTFTSQLLLLLLLSVRFGIQRGRLAASAAQELIKEIGSLPEKVAITLQSTATDSLRIAATYAPHESFLFLARGLCYPIALEGALKLKELSYAHAEGYPAGEMKHGPIALIKENYPVVVIVPNDSSREKMLVSMQQIKARGARILAVTNATDDRVESLADDLLHFPTVSPVLAPILAVIPLQLLAYHIATMRGHDVDHPRNLAKSVTVE